MTVNIPLSTSFGSHNFQLTYSKEPCLKPIFFVSANASSHYRQGLTNEYVRKLRQPATNDNNKVVKNKDRKSPGFQKLLIKNKGRKKQEMRGSDLWGKKGFLRAPSQRGIILLRAAAFIKAISNDHAVVIQPSRAEFRLSVFMFEVWGHTYRAGPSLRILH